MRGDVGHGYDPSHLRVQVFSTYTVLVLAGFLGDYWQLHLQQDIRRLSLVLSISPTFFLRFNLQFVRRFMNLFGSTQFLIWRFSRQTSFCANKQFVRAETCPSALLFKIRFVSADTGCSLNIVFFALKFCDFSVLCQKVLPHTDQYVHTLTGPESTIQSKKISKNNI